MNVLFAVMVLAAAKLPPAESTEFAPKSGASVMKNDVSDKDL